MKRFTHWILAGLIICLSVTASHAALVSINDPGFGLGSITLDTSSNLEWLDVTQSTNRSFDDVITQFGPGGDFEGWRHATYSELYGLVTGAGVDLNTTLGASPQMMNLIGLLGATVDTSTPNISVFQKTRGSLSEDGFIPEQAALVNQIGGHPSGGLHALDTEIPLFPDESMPSVGHFLVRVVPEPGSVALMGFGAAVLLRGRGANQA